MEKMLTASIQDEDERKGQESRPSIATRISMDTKAEHADLEIATKNEQEEKDKALREPEVEDELGRADKMPTKIKKCKKKKEKPTTKERIGRGDEWEEMEEEEELTERDDDEEEDTTCCRSDSEKSLGPRWDDLAEDDLGFLLLSDPGIYEALQLKEKEREFSPDGCDAYLEMCKDFGVPPIRSFLKQLFTETADLKFYGANAKNIRSLAQALKYNRYVTSLDLTETLLDHAALYEIAELIRENITLKTIILKKCKIGPEGAKYLGDTLDLSVTLEKLDLAANWLGDEGVDIIAPAIGRNTSLKSIDLSSNGIGQLGAKALGTVLKESQTLSELILCWNNLFEEPVEKGFKVLLNALSQPEIPIEKIDLSWNALGETSAPFIRALMVKAPQLRELCLHHNRFADAAALSLKRALLRAPQLEIFRMGFNPMTSEAAYALLSAVTPQLKTLDLGGICVNKKFLTLKTKKMTELGVEIIHGEPLSAYVIGPVDMAKLMLKRARFEGLKPKKAKKKKDFGHLLLEFDIDNIRTLDPDDFIRRLRSKKIKVREELVRGIMAIFRNKWGHVNVEHMLDRYMELFPDTQLPPPKPKKEKKKKGKKGKKQEM